VSCLGEECSKTKENESEARDAEEGKVNGTALEEINAIIRSGTNL